MKLTRKGKQTTATGRKRSDYVIKSHIADKAKQAILAEIRTQTKEMQKPKYGNGPTIVGRFNAYILGVHTYYNCATNCSLDFEDIAFRSRAILKNRLQPRRRRKNEKLPAYIERLYGKSKAIRFVYDTPLLPVSYIQHKVCLNHSGISQYIPADRSKIHNKQKAVSLDKLRYLLANPVQDRSVQYNDNRLSLFVGQYGRCAVSGNTLEIEDIHCHHKKLKAHGGTDDYANLVIVSDDVHKLIHAVNPLVISHYRARLDLSEAKLKKLNVLREKAKLAPIL